MTTFDVGDMHPNTPHLFADLVELLSIYKYMGRDFIHKNDIASLLNISNTSFDEVDLESDEISRISSGAVLNDRSERQLENLWLQLEYRYASLGDSYPFVVEGDEITLKDTFTNKHRVYIFLLSCSRLRSFIRITGAAQRWARGYAVVCKFAAQALLPNHGIARVFDANSEDRRTYYGTDLRQALRIMGKDLGVKRIDEEECDKAGSSGDGGFDIIATFDFEDNQHSNFGILGQCGAQEEGWPKKSLEAHSINLGTYFHTNFIYPSIMFTPVLYRDSNGEWVTTRPTSGVILIDRPRVMFLLEKSDFWDDLVSFDWFNTFEEEFSNVIAEP
ncbi:hypothetical protein [Yersinia pseudotuberculosis]|uniref:hypothetical protein n=1 Tax=Yersinia pseudotuberculosis TaxID=633 RepID=UPI0005E2F4C0|nr:hypothetical protein [Yersinia pseudotuberculosis]CNC28836.1 Uncharacterised protein [Yersinia pseudotuberculosis]